jgi:glycine/D-amino acid oxidase-like deaminating enzyme
LINVFWDTYCRGRQPMHGSWDAGDVAIVGGGVHGAAAAYHLAGHGCSVVLLERSYPADGPTGLSTAVCRAYYTNEFLADVAADSLAFFSRFAALTGGDAAFRRCGALYLHPPEDGVAVDATVALLRGRGHDISVVDAAAVRDLVPGIDMRGTGSAVWEPGGGYADPVGTTRGLLEHAARRGVRCRMRTRVTHLHRQAGCWSLEVADGPPVTASRVLVAAGPWTGQLLATAGISLPLTAERHVVATMEPAAGSVLPCVLADLVGGVYLKPEGRSVCVGGLLPGPVVDPASPVSGLSGGDERRLLTPVVRRLPGYADAACTGGWASLYDVSPDWQPVIGEVAEGLFVDAGTSGHGFKLAPALGAHIARLVLGEQHDSRLAQFHPSRFARGGRLNAGFGDARILA